MKTILLAILAAAGGAAVAADSPVAGTWKLNVAKSRFTGDTMSFNKTATGYHFSDGSPISQDFAVDGHDYPVMSGRTVAWTGAGTNAWNIVVKQNGVDLVDIHRELSADGKMMNSSYVEHRPDGSTTRESDVYKRLTGTSGLVGKWEDVKVSAASDGFMVAIPTPGAYRIEFPVDKVVIEGRSDGSPADVTGPTVPAAAKFMASAVAPNRWTYSERIGDKVVGKGEMTVSSDGSSLTRKNWIPGKKTEASMSVYDRQ